MRVVLAMSCDQIDQSVRKTSLSKIRSSFMDTGRSGTKIKLVLTPHTGYRGFPVVTTSPREHACHQGSLAALSGGEEETQEETSGAEPQFYFMVFRCPGCYRITMVFSHKQMVVFVCPLLDCPLPAHGRQSKAYRRMFLPKEAALRAS